MLKEKKVASSMLPIHEDRDRPWNGPAAMQRVRDWAGAEDAPNAQYKKAFMWYDAENPEEFGSYKLPIADVIDGELKAVFRGCAAAKAACMGARGGVNIPEGDKEKVLAMIQRYYDKWGVEESVNLTCGFDVVSIPESIETTSKAARNDGLGYGEVEVVVSNSAVDRHGESIIMQGIDVSQVKRNPVLLWAHQYDNLPIGKIVKLWKEDGNLKAVIRLAYDIYSFADTVYKMILAGVINAVSIGGIVKEWDDEFTTIKKMEMIELSVVPVGAHPDALVTAKSLGMESADIRDSFNEFVAKTTIEKLKSIPIDDKSKYVVMLKELVQILEGSTKAKESTETAPKKVTKIIKYTL